MQHLHFKAFTVSLSCYYNAYIRTRVIFQNVKTLWQKAIFDVDTVWSIVFPSISLRGGQIAFITLAQNKCALPCFLAHNSSQHCSISWLTMTSMNITTNTTNCKLESINIHSYDIGMESKHIYSTCT